MFKRLPDVSIQMIRLHNIITAIVQFEETLGIEKIQKIILRDIP